jgi:hypothetical protein
LSSLASNHRRIWKRQKRERAWRPHTHRERADRAKGMQRDAFENANVCECGDGVPSWLCRGWRCYAFEIGTCDEPCLPGEHDCDCMIHAWGDEEYGIPEDSQRCRRRGRPLLYDANPMLPFEWLGPNIIPTPSSGWKAVMPQSEQGRQQGAA